MSAMLLFGVPGGTELIVILGIVLLLFGGSRLPQLAKGLGQSIKEFKKGVAQLEGGDDTEEGGVRKSALPAGASSGVVANEIARDGSVTGGRS